jgi:hypothetical protein
MKNLQIAPTLENLQITSQEINTDLPLEYLGITPPINPLKEKGAISEFLTNYWIIKSKKEFSLNQLVEIILKEGIDRGIAFQEREIVKEAYLLRTALDYLKPRTPIVIPEHLIKIEILSKGFDYKEFPEHIEDLASRLEKGYEYIFAEPKNYRIPQKKDKEDKPIFKGSKLHETIFKNWPSFEELMHKETVKKYDDEQLISPFKTMIAAILRQGMNIGVYCVEEKYGKLIHPHKYEPLKQN